MCHHCDLNLIDFVFLAQIIYRGVHVCCVTLCIVKPVYTMFVFVIKLSTYVQQHTYK